MHILVPYPTSEEYNIHGLASTYRTMHGLSTKHGNTHHLPFSVVIDDILCINFPDSLSRTVLSDRSKEGKSTFM